MQPYYRYWHYIVQTSSGHGTLAPSQFHTKGLKTDVEENDAHRFDDVVHD